MPSVQNRGSVYLVSNSAFPLDAKNMFKSDHINGYKTFAEMLANTFVAPILYNGLQIVDGDTGRIYRTTGGSGGAGNATTMRLVANDDKRVWTFTTDPEATHYFANPYQTETFDDALPDDIYVDSFTGNMFKVITDFPYFESVYTISDLIAGNINDTNTYPTSATFVSDTAPTLTITMGGDTDVQATFSSGPLPIATSGVAGLVSVTDQTFTGVKTFSSVPILPATGIRFTSNGTLLKSGNHSLTLTTSDTTNAIIPQGTVTLVDLGTTQTITAIKTFSNVITGTKGTAITGSDINLNVTSNFPVNIATGNSTGTVTIGGANAQTISIGNGANAKTVNLGSVTTTSKTTIRGGNTSDAINFNTASGGGIRILTSDTGALHIDSGTTGALTIGTGSSAKSITIGNNTGATSLNLKSGTDGMNLTVTSDLNVETLVAGTAFNVNIAKTNTSTGTTIYLGNAGNIVIGSDLSDAARTCLIYKTTQIGSSSNNKSLTVNGNIVSTGFARAGLKTYSNPTAVDLQLSDGNTHCITNTGRTALTLSVYNVMSDVYNNYSGGSFIITIRNNHTSDLTVTLSDTLFDANDGETVTIGTSDAITYSGIILGTATSDCYLYGVIAPASQNLMS